MFLKGHLTITSVIWLYVCYHKVVDDVYIIVNLNFCCYLGMVWVESDMFLFVCEKEIHVLLS